MVPVEAMMVPTEDGQSYSIRLAGKKKKVAAKSEKQRKNLPTSLFLFYRKATSRRARARACDIRRNREEKDKLRGREGEREQTKATHRGI